MKQKVVKLNGRSGEGQRGRAGGMSVSGFHHQFKAVKAVSPLRFQKQPRLQEARRLLLVGAPPMRDVGRLRGTALIRPELATSAGHL